MKTRWCPRRAILSADADADTERVVDLDAARAAIDVCHHERRVRRSGDDAVWTHVRTRGAREMDHPRRARIAGPGPTGERRAGDGCPRRIVRSVDRGHELPHEWPWVNTTVRECVEAVFGKSARTRRRQERRAARDAEGGNVDGDGGGGDDAGVRGRGDGGSASTRGVPLMRETRALPMFFLDAVDAGQEVALNVFEAKYKILIRRCLMTSRKFLMINAEDADEEEFEKNLRDDDDRLECAGGDRGGVCARCRVSLREFGRFCVECAIVTCQELVDGRFLVRVRAMHHVFVRSAVRDPSGYCVGTCSLRA